MFMLLDGSVNNNSMLGKKTCHVIRREEGSGEENP